MCIHRHYCNVHGLRIHVQVRNFSIHVPDVQANNFTHTKKCVCNIQSLERWISSLRVSLWSKFVWFYRLLPFNYLILPNFKKNKIKITSKKNRIHLILLHQSSCKTETFRAIEDNKFLIAFKNQLFPIHCMTRN